jgi:hypothetical protein
MGSSFGVVVGFAATHGWEGHGIDREFTSGKVGYSWV